MVLLACLTTLLPGPTAVTPNGFSAIEPQVTTEGKRVFVACGDKNRVFVMRSSDGGASFSSPVTLPTGGHLALGMRRGPRIALAGGSLVVTAVCGRQGGGKDGELVAWRSTDEGRTWRGPASVSDVPGSAREGLHGMAASAKGALACAWLDLRNTGTEIWAARSSDGGASWTKNVLVYRSPSGTVCECCHPSVAFGPDEKLYVMFRNSLAGARDMYLAVSKDGGDSFEPATKLGRGTWPLNACPMDGGALAVDSNGAIETVWRRQGDVFACRPGEAERRLGAGTQPWIAAGSPVVWQSEGRVQTTKGSLPEGNDPVIADVEGKPLVVWADASRRIWAQRLP